MTETSVIAVAAGNDRFQLCASAVAAVAISGSRILSATRNSA